MKDMKKSWNGILSGIMLVRAKHNRNLLRTPVDTKADLSDFDSNSDCGINSRADSRVNCGADFGIYSRAEFKSGMDLGITICYGNEIRYDSRIGMSFEMRISSELKLK